MGEKIQTESLNKTKMALKKLHVYFLSFCHIRIVIMIMHQVVLPVKFEAPLHGFCVV